MDTNKKKLIIAGSILGVLFMIAVYVWFFTGPSPEPANADDSAKIVQEMATEEQKNPPPPPPQIAPEEPGARAGKARRDP